MTFDSRRFTDRFRSNKNAKNIDCVAFFRPKHNWDGWTHTPGSIYDRRECKDCGKRESRYHDFLADWKP